MIWLYYYYKEFYTVRISNEQKEVHFRENCKIIFF